MKDSLENLFDKLGLTKDNGLFFKEDNLNVNGRIEYSLKHIDYDAIYILDNNPLIIFKQFSDADYQKIDAFRKNIWNLNDIPVIFIVLPDEIEVYNANIFDDKESILDKFTKEDDLDIFNIYNLSSGAFFDVYEDSFNKSVKVQNYLLDNINETIVSLTKNSLPLKLIHNLIGKLLFSKYLVDRSIFSDDFFEKRYKTSFDEIILNKIHLSDFFSFIEEKFNDELFPIHQDDFDLISDDDLCKIYQLFKGYDMKNAQSVLTCPYDFKIIPIELISNIYELFLDNADNTKSFYTPLFLVDYVLNETLDQKLNGEKSCKILDPSCRSGVFLVEALRRIIEHNLKTNPDLTPDDLKEILTDNIYGIDIDKDAINITLLSIQLTLFDYLTNEQINSFEMPKLLNKNFFADDFFNLDGKFNELDDFDLIIGNPPWGSKNELHIDYCKKNNIPYSNNQIAQSFLLRVKDFTHENSEMSQIISSSILYNTNSEDFRHYFLENFNLKEILECCAVREEIFKNTKGPGCVIFYNNSINHAEPIKHISLKPNRLFYLLSSIVIQKNDVKYISQEDLKNNDWVWKVLIYGNTLDFDLISQIRNKKTFNEFDLNISKGIQISGDKNYDAKKYLNHDFLDVSKKMLHRYYIWNNDDSKWSIEKVSRIRNEKVFTPPYILLTQGLNSDFQCVATYSEKEWVFRNSVISITLNNENEKVLKCMLGFLNSKLFTYIAFLTFSSVGVERNVLRLNELKTLPLIIDERLEKYVNEILDNPKSNELQEKIDELIFDLFSINGLEKELINYLHEVTIPMYKKDNVFYNVKKDELTDYINIFFNTFKHFFNEENNEFLHAVCYYSKQFVGIEFIISDEKADEVIKFEENKIVNFMGSLSIEDKNSLLIQKDIKGFNKTSFFVIKTNEFKNWHKAIAHRDVIEFMNSLMGVED